MPSPRDRETLIQAKPTMRTKKSKPLGTPGAERSPGQQVAPPWTDPSAAFGGSWPEDRAGRGGYEQLGRAVLPWRRSHWPILDACRCAFRSSHNDRG
jgi:hypothetical protein